MTDFALIGASGYIAPRHLGAIKAVGGNLTVAFDPSDSVGILDRDFPDAHFFTEFERFDRHVDKLRRKGNRIDYVSVCSPNYLHDAHCRFGLRCDADVICEKPLVLNPWNIDGLADLERDTGRKISTILQLRLHPIVRELKRKIESSDGRHVLDLTYITSRGRWYHASWKGDDNKSGGVATNIGVHFFDMLGYVLGRKLSAKAHLRDDSRAAGTLSFEKGDVRWFLSVDREDLPAHVQGTKTTYRSFTLNGEEVEFSEGFTELHNDSYREIVAGRGFGLEEVRPSIEIVSEFRNAPIVSGGERHAYVTRRAA